MESLAADLKQMQRTPLAERHVDALRAAGEARVFEAGEMVARPGDPMEDFLYIEEGEIEVVDPATDGRLVESTLGPTQFVGEIAFLTGGAHAMPMRACARTRVTAVPRTEMLRLMSVTPEMSDIVLSVFAARRRRLLEAGHSVLKVIGADVDQDVQRVAQFASRNRIPVQTMDLRSEAAEAERTACALDGCRPAVIFAGEPVEPPTPRAVAERLGLALAPSGEEIFDVLIVGGGPAGVAAAVYAGAEGLSALVVEDTAIGGQAGTSSRIENYMGFPTGISGGDLCWRGEVQAMKFGTRFAMPARATHLNRQEDGLWCVTLDCRSQVCARAVVVATGVQYRKLPIDRLEAFEGRGIYYAATDMEARWCRGTEAVVIGGGNSAGQAAMFLCRSARHVHLLVRSDGLAASMSSYLSERLEEDASVTIHYQTEMVGLHGDERLEGVTVRDGAGAERRIDTRAVFVMVGAAPNTGWLDGHVALDKGGFVPTGPEADARSAYETSAPGIFAVGDVRSGSVKRVASSVGEGSVVISAAWNHVSQAGGD